MRLREGAFHEDAGADWKGGDVAHLSLATDAIRIAEWLSSILNQRCRLVENTRPRISRRRRSIGPTVISTATIREVAGWFDDLAIEETRRRFRANLEINAPTFWEDQLVGATRLKPVRFRIGAVEFLGRDPCRCPVPTRSSETGEVTPLFAKTSRNMAKTHCRIRPRERFDHFYRLAVNTSLAGAKDDAILRVGDAAEVLN